MLLFHINKIELLGGWSLQAVFWTGTIVATCMLLIFGIYSIFAVEVEKEGLLRKKSVLQLEARNVLIFFTAFGWVGTLLSYFDIPINQIVLLSAITGLVIAILPIVAWKFFNPQKSPENQVFSSTARVLESIPPHRNGIGKVYLSQSRIPLELDAITIGRELPVGVPVRIVDMLDERTAVVEPLDSGFNRVGNKDDAPV